MKETNNVTYQGTLQAAGASIFMEGTHKLVLEDERFIMLQSNDVDLNAFIGKKVEVLGAVRPTVEAGGMILRVEKVTSMEPSSSSSSAESQSSDSSVSSAISSATASSVVSVSSASSANTTSSSYMSSIPSSAAAVSSAVPVAQSSAPAYEASTELSEKAAVMAKDKMDAGLWTQQYCTKTAGYCISIHKNWYYTSFGATSSTLWHLEVGPQEINNIGEGPLSVNIVSGATSLDGQVKAEAGGVVGYKAWTDGRHFEIRGPANLQAAISYMLGTIKPH